LRLVFLGITIIKTNPTSFLIKKLQKLAPHMRSALIAVINSQGACAVAKLVQFFLLISLTIHFYNLDNKTPLNIYSFRKSVIIIFAKIPVNQIKGPLNLAQDS